MPKGSVNGVIEYEGFCVDLLDKLAEYLNFEYTLYIVKDGKYGEPINATTEWSGMIGEILHGVCLLVHFIAPFYPERKIFNKNCLH